MAYDENEIKLKIDEIYTRLYTGESRTVDQACDAAGVSRGTLVNWRNDKAQLVDQIRSETYSRIMAQRREDEEALAAEKHALKTRILRRTYQGLELAIEREIQALQNEKTAPFVIDSIAKTLMNWTRDEFDKEKSKITINAGGQDEEPPKQLPPQRPYQVLPDPSTIKPATSVELASEVTLKKHRDGTLEKHEVQYPQVLENETPSN